MAQAIDIAHCTLPMMGYGNQPAVLLIADSEAAARRGRDIVALGGARVSGVVAVEDALEEIDRRLVIDGLWLEIEADHGAELDALLDRAQAEADAQRFGAVISAPSSLIDIVDARIAPSRMLHLCEPSDEERLEAIGAMLTPKQQRLHDVNRGANGRLQQISEEAGRLASALAELSEEEKQQAADERGEAAAITPAAIRAIIRARRLRDRFFPDGLFADPAWDMMLDLMAARLEQRRVAVSSLCIAAAVPPTTALRWIRTLTDAGLFARTADPQDGRRIYVELTDSAAAGFDGYLRAVARLGSAVI